MALQILCDLKPRVQGIQTLSQAFLLNVASALLVMIVLLNLGFEKQWTETRCLVEEAARDLGRSVPSCRGLSPC